MLTKSHAPIRQPGRRPIRDAGRSGQSGANFALLGACSLAIALPLLSTLGAGATFFVAHGAQPVDILIFVFGLFFLPPVLLIGVAQLFKVFAGSPVANGFISIALGLLATLWALSLTSSFPAIIAILFGLLFGALVCWGDMTRPGVRSFVKIIGQISPAILIFFFAFSPVKNLILPGAEFSRGSTDGAKVPVVMLIFDELSMASLVTPDGEIDAGRLPNFARLERMSTWYSDATTVSIATEKAIPAILTGLSPDSETLPIYSQFPQNLFTVLGDSHEIHALEAISRLCPERLCHPADGAANVRFNPGAMVSDAWYVWLHAILPAEIGQRVLPPISSGWRDFSPRGEGSLHHHDDARYGQLVKAIVNNPTVLDVPVLGEFRDGRFREFIANVRTATGAQLNYLHMTFPHHPWIYLPDGSIYNGKKLLGLTGENTWRESQGLADQAARQFALQLEYVDTLLGELLDVLEQSDQFSETLLIVLADHGLAIEAGKSLRTPDASTLADVSRVPLFIKYPGQQTRNRDRRKVQTIDVLPTITEVLEIELKEPVDGISLVSRHWQPVTRHLLEAEGQIENFEAAMDMKRASERFYRVLEPGETALDAFGVASSRSLIGTSPPEPSNGGNRMTLQLDNPELYSDLSLKSDILPVRLTGKVSGAVRKTEIVIALNNTFAGSGRTYDDQGSLSVLLDPRYFRAGLNELAAYSLSAGELERLAISSAETTD